VRWKSWLISFLTSLVVIDKNCPFPTFCSLSHSWSHPLQNKVHWLLSSATSLCLPYPLLFPKCYLRPDPPKRSCCTIFAQPASLLIKLLDMRYLSWAFFVCSVRCFPNILVPKLGTRWASSMLLLSQLVNSALPIYAVLPSLLLPQGRHLLYRGAYPGDYISLPKPHRWKLPSLNLDKCTRIWAALPGSLTPN
jgi:hypothetical protein